MLHKQSKEPTSNISSVWCLTSRLVRIRNFVEKRMRRFLGSVSPSPACISVIVNIVDIFWTSSNLCERILDEENAY